MHKLFRATLAAILTLYPLAASATAPPMPPAPTDRRELGNGSFHSPPMPREVKWVAAIGLSVVGGLMALYGFKKIKTSQPGLDISDVHWTKTQAINWYVDSYGTVRNTGNVPLKNVKIRRSYYGASGEFLGNDYCYLDVHWLDPLPAGARDSWDYFAGGWASEPSRMDVTATYDFDETFKQKSKAAGWGGVAIMAVGCYLIWDLITDESVSGCLGPSVRLEPFFNPEAGLLLAYDF